MIILGYTNLYSDKILNELKIDLMEVEACRNLQSESFDFGNGLVVNNSKESEDAYYEMKEQFLSELIDKYTYGLRIKNYKSKKRNNRYFRKQIAKRKLEYLSNQGVYFVYETEDKENGKKYIKQFYISGRREYAKKETNKRIRKSKNDFSLKGGGYRKKFDYWWTVF